MDLPAGHELRGKLAAKKVVYENLLEVLLGFIIWGPLSSMNNWTFPSLWNVMRGWKPARTISWKNIPVAAALRLVISLDQMFFCEWVLEWVKLFCDVWVEVYFSITLISISPPFTQANSENHPTLPVQVNSGRLLRAQARAVAAELSKIGDAWSVFECGCRCHLRSMCDRLGLPTFIYR